MPSSGQLIRERRLANGLTQAQLALRAGTSQAAISRLERDELSPSLDTLENVLLVMGERPTVHASRIEPGHDAAHLADARRRSPAERLELAISWNRLAGEFARAGAIARGA